MTIITNKVRIDLTAWIKQNIYQLVGLFLVLCVIYFAYGCDSKVPSIAHPSQSVTRSELQVEINHYLALAEVRFSQLDRQDEFKQLVFQTAFIIAEKGTISIPGLLTTIVAIFGTGAIVDNRRKAKQLKDANNKNA